MIIRLLLFLLLITLPVLPASPAGAATEEIGFMQLSLPDGADVGIWYPSRGTTSHQRIRFFEQDVVADGPLIGARLPLIVMSHGMGGSFADHLDTAGALARNGFIVAALSHPGDNWQDQSRVSQVEDRPAQLRSLITFLLNGWRFHGRVDPARIGAFGFSLGGFTVLTAAGGEPDPQRVQAACAAHPEFLECKLLATHPRSTMVWPDVSDPRIKALVVAAPALGFGFGRRGLEKVRIPVQLWRADDDRILPSPFYAGAVRAALPRPPEFHPVPGAGHLDFLAPCAPASADIPVCGSAPGFDRKAFHRRFNEAVLRFFRRTLG